MSKRFRYILLVFIWSYLSLFIFIYFRWTLCSCFCWNLSSLSTCFLQADTFRYVWCTYSRMIFTHQNFIAQTFDMVTDLSACHSGVFSSFNQYHEIPHLDQSFMEISQETPNSVEEFNAHRVNLSQQSIPSSVKAIISQRKHPKIQQRTKGNYYHLIIILQLISLGDNE